MQHTDVEPGVRIFDGRGRNGADFEGIVRGLRAEAERVVAQSAYAKGLMVLVAVAHTDGPGGEVTGESVLELDVRPGATSMPVRDVLACGACGETDPRYCRHLRQFVAERAA